MNESNQIKHIFYAYVGKHFSLRSRVLFGKWLLAKGYKEEKSMLLQQLWEESRGEITDNTKQDWQRLSKINEQKHLHLRFIPRWTKYAAAIILLLLSIGGTYWTTMQTMQTYQNEMVELFVPYGDDRQLTLPDGSEVWVKAGSLLVYPEDFRSSDTRTIYLTGEAAFKVKKNKEQPFIVKTSCLDVQALGTIFTIESYPNDSFTTATLEEGSVLVSLKNKEKESVILKPNEQLFYSHLSHKSKVQTIDISSYKMARKGYLIFENATFSQLISAIEKKYNVTIHYNSTKYASEYYNVKFSPNESVEEVMDILKQLAGIKYHIKDNNIIIN